MRAIFVLAVVLSAAVGLVSSGGAEPVEPPTRYRATPPTSPSSPPVLPNPPVVAPPSYVNVPPTVPAYPPPYGGPVSGYYAAQPSHDELQSLRQQYAKLATKRAERMEAEELKKGIADMRRNCLIAELMELGNNADGFDAMRAGVALAALSAKDRPDLEKLSRDLVKELEVKATKE